MLQLVKFNEVNHLQQSGEARPLKTIISQPKFMTAVFIGMISYTVMNLLMTATPLAMHRHGFELEASALVIEWHVLGMFVPSFFTGKLIERFGQVNIMFVGIVLVLLCCLVNLLGLSHWHFLTALFLLGVGWNFMFISATQMVSQTYLPTERAKAQATNEFLVFSMVTLSALSAGWLEATLGWQTLNLITLPVLIVSALWLAIFKIKQKASTVATANFN